MRQVSQSPSGPVSSIRPVCGSLWVHTHCPLCSHTHAQAVRVYLPVPTWFQSGFSSSYDRHWNETQLNTTTTSTHQSSPVELFVFSSWTFLL